MEDQAIEYIDRLKWLLLVICCAAAVLYGFAMKRKALRAFASANLLGVLMPDVSLPRQYAKAILLLAAMVFIVAALMGPRWGSYWEDAVQRQLELMVCLDVSRSMLAEDAGMSRLDRAKDDLKRLLDQLLGGTIGLVTFAGRAELTCPLTDDYDFYRLALDDVGIHSAPLGGTNLGEAIAAAVKAFGNRGPQQRVILLITDGEDHGDRALEEARKAREQDIRIYTIGVGDQDRGGLIPVEREGRKTFLMYEGQQLWTKLDPARLQAIARVGGGEYHPSGQVTAGQRTVEWIYTEKLRPMEERTLKKKLVRRRHARFHWVAAVALALLVLETLISERRPTVPAGARSGK